MLRQYSSYQGKDFLRGYVHVTNVMLGLRTDLAPQSEITFFVGNCCFGLLPSSDEYF